jgi:hypothetical protein
MVEITYPYIGEMMIIPIDGVLTYYGHVIVSQGRGVYTNPCKTEEAAKLAAEQILEEFMNRR